MLRPDVPPPNAGYDNAQDKQDWDPFRFADGSSQQVLATWNARKWAGDKHDCEGDSCQDEGVLETPGTEKWPG